MRRNKVRWHHHMHAHSPWDVHCTLPPLHRAPDLPSVPTCVRTPPISVAISVIAQLRSVCSVPPKSAAALLSIWDTIVTYESWGQSRTQVTDSPAGAELQVGSLRLHRSPSPALDHRCAAPSHDLHHTTAAPSAPLHHSLSSPLTRWRGLIFSFPGRFLPVPQLHPQLSVPLRHQASQRPSTRHEGMHWWQFTGSDLHLMLAGDNITHPSRTDPRPRPLPPCGCCLLPATTRRIS